MSQAAFATDSGSIALTEVGVLESQKPPVVQPAWDPYEVWLTRVKQPRERAARSRRDDSSPVTPRGWIIRV